MGPFCSALFLLGSLTTSQLSFSQGTKLMTPPPITPSNTSTRTASTYVALDSSIYPAFDRLAALGAVQTAFAGLRPWTLMECVRLLDEMDQRQGDGYLDDDETAIYAALRSEFAGEMRRSEGGPKVEAQLESVYLRTDAIAGAPLNDGFHFAQTHTNDFGRPFGEGWNSYTGASLYATAGPFAAYVRAEVQRAGTVADAPTGAQAAIAAADFTQTAQLGPVANVARGRVLDAYVSAGFSGNQFSFGKQSLWWGPGNGGPLLWSDNAEPITMLRYDRTSPVKLPWVAGLLGAVRGQFFLGRLGGHQFVHTHDQTLGQAGSAYADQPFIHGEKVSFRPTQNFEFSVSRTVIFGGPGAPVTASSFWRSLVSWSTAAGAGDPGDRRSAVDVSYRVPGVRDWLTVYADTFTDDEPFPLAYPTQSAWSPGFYLPKLPHLHRLDLRAEGCLTPRRVLFPGFYYFNVRYLGGYTNNRQLIGSWIGREGGGFEVWSTWWISPRASVQGSVRGMTADPEFLGGGDLHDVSLSSDLSMGREWSARLSGQYERWQYPLLRAGVSGNFTASAQLTWTPPSRPR